MSQWVAGADACPDWKWVVTFVNLDAPNSVHTRRVNKIEEILDSEEAPSVVAVDIPMGLPDRIGQEGRGPENCVRRFLGPLKSAVYPVPARAVVHALAQWPEGASLIAHEHRRLSSMAKERSEPPKGISRQTFGLLPRIKELDVLLQKRAADRSKIFEIHPEVAFWSMNGESALKHSKKTPDGDSERRELLVASGIPHAAAYARHPQGAKPDDYLDALAALVVAKHLANGNRRPFPDPPIIDPMGLRIAIWSFRLE